MNRISNTNNLKRIDDNQFVKGCYPEKPVISVNRDAKVIGCNQAFLTLFKIAENHLPGTDLSGIAFNRKFIDSVHKAGIEGISIFFGIVKFGNDLPEIYAECALFCSPKEKRQQDEITCYILESKIPDLLSSGVIDNADFADAIPRSAYASVSVHDANGSIIYISPSIEELLGYSCSELNKMDTLELVYPKDVPIIRNAIDKLQSGHDFVNSRYRMIHKNGSVIEVETVSYAINDSTGKGLFIVNTTWDLSSQLNTERALWRSEQKYYHLVMNLPTGVSLISRSGQLLEANAAMKKIMGMPLDDSIPKINFFSAGRMKRAGISEQLQRCIDTKKMQTGDLQYKSNIRKQDIFLNYCFVPVLEHDGNVETILGYVSDLTQQKKAESDYRERADFLNLVINAIKTPFFVKDEAHKWVMLNDAAIEMMGQPREALLGKSDYDLFPKEQADVFWKYDELVFKTGNQSNEEQITWHDGTLHTIVTHKQLYIEKPSGKKFIVGTIHDISSYKKIEAELRASEMKYRELFDNANDFIVTMDLDGNFTNANRTLLQYMNTDLGSFTKRNVFEFIREESREKALSMREKLLSGNTDISFEINSLGRQGEPVIYEIKASAIIQNGKINGVQCVFSDVTSRSEASLRLEEYNRNLLELNKTKDKFFSILAHDLRNPYSSLIGFSELLLEDLDELSKDEITSYLKIIRNAAKNSLNLLENLLSWSRLETGRMPFDPTKVELSAVAEEIVNILFSLAYRKKLTVNNLVKPGTMLFADKNMINIILNNLIMNAIKYTPTGGEINISAGDVWVNPDTGIHFIKISVADTGVGMDAEVTEKLFTLNKLTSSPGTENEQGTGLGLVLTREMVEKHGGSIKVESTPGKGSVFSFFIPMFDPENTIS